MNQFIWKLPHSMESKRLIELRAALKKLADQQKKAGYMRFFKTAMGEYGFGDKFYGIRVPDQRNILKKYVTLSLEEIDLLLRSEYHEERFIALQILVHQFQKGADNAKCEIYNFYIDHTDCINNWDLVDSSAPQIVGAYLFKKPRDLLVAFATDKNLWKKRISILATFYFIRKNDFGTTMQLSELLLNDDHDLIHKAVGWMLREVANRNMNIAREFLEKHCKVMPRTMLRYTVEKFPEELRREYMERRKNSF